jgi:hypothetical protein
LFNRSLLYREKVVSVFVRFFIDASGLPLSDGAITPDDILRIKDQQLFNSIW